LKESDMVVVPGKLVNQIAVEMFGADPLGLPFQNGELAFLIRTAKPFYGMRTFTGAPGEIGKTSRALGGYVTVLGAPGEIYSSQNTNGAAAALPNNPFIEFFNNASAAARVQVAGGSPVLLGPLSVIAPNTNALSPNAYRTIKPFSDLLGFGVGSRSQAMT